MMAGNKNSGRKPKIGGKRTSILIEAPTVVALTYIRKVSGKSQGEIIDLAIEEYFLNHYEKELEEKINAENSNQA